MDPRVREVLVASLVAAAVFLFTAGIDTPDGDIRSCDQAYNVVENKIFTSEQLRFNMELYEKRCLGGQESLIDDRTFHGTRDVGSLGLSSDEAAAANLIRRQHALASVCDQFEKCVRENSRVVISSWGFFKRILMWGAIGFVGVIVVAATGNTTLFGRFVPMALALVAVAVTTVVRYWGEPDSGTSLAVVVSGGAFALLFVFMIASTANPTVVISTGSSKSDGGDWGRRATLLARAVVLGAGEVAPSLQRGQIVSKSTAIGSIGLVNFDGEIPDSIVQDWATVISRDAEEFTRASQRTVASHLRKAIEKASRSKANGKINIELGEIALEFIKKFRVKNPEHAVETLRVEHRRPSAFLLRLDMESAADIQYAKQNSCLLAKTKSQTEALGSLIPEDKVMVATKKNFIIGCGTMPLVTNYHWPENSEYEYARKIDWAWLIEDPSRHTPIASVFEDLKCPRAPRRTITEIEFDSCLSLMRELEPPVRSG